VVMEEAMAADTVGGMDKINTVILTNTKMTTVMMFHLSITEQLSSTTKKNTGKKDFKVKKIQVNILLVMEGLVITTKLVIILLVDMVEVV